jgi:ribosomal protein S12
LWILKLIIRQENFNSNPYVNGNGAKLEESDVVLEEKKSYEDKNNIDYKLKKKDDFSGNEINII